MSGEDKVDSSNNVLTSYTSSILYNTAGQVTSMVDGSGVTESYTYSSDRLQLTRQTATKSGSTLMDLNYNYAATAGASGVNTTAGNSGQLMAIGNNPSSQPSTINGQTRTQAFTYDDLGRLATATGWSTWQRRFAYDRWANRTGVWDATSGGTQIQSVTLQQQAGAPAGVPSNRATAITNSGMALTQTYDAAGNLTGDGMHNYQYDGENRIAKVDAGTLNEADYFYDANNWRVKKITSNNAYTTYSIWEGGQVIAEYGNAPTGAAGNSYYLADRLSNRMITDTSGAFKGTQDHLPFGEEGGTTGASEKHRFTNYERDAESNTDYAMNRQYEMGNGRYKQPDVVAGSIADPQSLNRYAYSLDDPVNVNDPQGLFPTVPDQFNAAYSGPGIYWDGIRLMITEYEMVYRFWLSGAVDIFPDGAVRNRRGDGWIIPTGEDSSIDVSEFNDLWRFVGLIQKIVPDAITSNQDVLRDLYCLWKLGGYGVRDTERSLWITNNAGNYGSVPWPWSAESKTETWKGPLPVGTVADAHTHPDRSISLSKAGPQPSTTGGRTGKGDQGTADQIGLPVYVVTGQAIWKAVPHAKAPVQVAGQDWWKPFDKAKVKCK